MNGNIIINIDKGRNIFHLININISYRNRGYVPRTQINIIVIMIIIVIEMIDLIGLKNIIVEIILKISILKYSDRKIKANHPPIYSTLKPETNSDSPSAKSNGLRLVSAKQEDNHIINKRIFPKKKYNIY
ncbi:MULTISPECIES: hypothetical protein [Gammaproteobacteria]|uniref:hypothetical protein n=1 Tax=Kineobactrum sediminis TaxID=1905677 RepID=UPI001F4E3761|nr:MULTISPECIES: hypothetical protein [Gammaproteobacteria]